ncbi:hypothetical protein [Dactylosporangium sp. NPDC005555]|uniref:hypothetical protein n=1 Tax=Dactylosporangium sp. NPDC005555 TaxID=3154889 RepID=UPI0033BC07D0
MSDFSAAGGLEPFEWNHDEAIRYEVAIELIGEATACYTALIDRARTAGDEGGAERLRAERSRCAADRRRLSPTDHDDIARTSHAYAQLIRELRERLG